MVFSLTCCDFSWYCAFGITRSFPFFGLFIYLFFVVFLLVSIFMYILCTFLYLHGPLVGIFHLYIYCILSPRDLSLFLRYISHTTLSLGSADLGLGGV